MKGLKDLADELKEVLYQVSSISFRKDVSLQSKAALRQVKHYLAVADFHLYDRDTEVALFETGFDIDDEVVCINDDTEDVDFGASGIVLKGNRELTLKKIYVIENFIFRNVPNNNRQVWTPEEYEKVKLYWVQVWLKGMDHPQWLHNFKKK